MHSMIAAASSCGRRARHVFAARGRLGENGADQEGTVGTNGGCGGIPLCGQDSGYKGPVQARRAIGLRACGAVISGNLAEVFARQIGMLGNDRPIDEPDLHFRATAGAFHQRRELDQFQRVHNVMP